jgi:hypothetical protein
MSFLLGLPLISKYYIGSIENGGRHSPISGRTFTLISVLLGGIFTFICYHYRIVTDMYGDSRSLIEYLSWKKLSILDVINPGNKEPLTQIFHQFVAYAFGVNIKSAYEIVSSVCGGIFLTLLIFFIRQVNGSKVWKIFIFVLFSTTGANQIFFGHVEDYTLIYLTIILFFITGWMLFNGKKTLGVMVFIFIVGTRIHLEMLLLLPALIFAISHTVSIKYPKVAGWLMPKKIFAVMISTLICGTLAYFYYFKAYHYEGTGVDEILSKIFLPIYDHLPEQHYYTLQSLSHFSDFIQELLMTVSPVAFLILCLSFIFFRRINWREPQIVFYALAVFYFLLFNFTVNPSLSMSRDWDFLASGALPVLFLALTLSKKIFADILSIPQQKKIIGAGLALGIFSFTLFYVNSNPSTASWRLEGIGKWAFKSYYSSSSYILNVSAKMEENLDKQIERRKNVIIDLLPYSSKPDLEIGFLYHKFGVALYANRQFVEAAVSFNKSLEQDPKNASAIKLLALITLQQKNFYEAERILIFYNRNINQPVIKDKQGLELIEYCKQLRNLVSSNGDSLTIQNKLEYVFQITK